jgi:hypothetical protein
VKIDALIERLGRSSLGPTSYLYSPRSASNSCYPKFGCSFLYSPYPSGRGKSRTPDVFKSELYVGVLD